MGHNPRMELCPKQLRKMKKKKKKKKLKKMGEMGFSGKLGEKWKNRAKGRPAVGGMVRERPAVGWGGGGFVMGDGDFWILGRILGGKRRRGVRLLYGRREK
jgi:hypothetical protein